MSDEREDITGTGTPAAEPSEEALDAAASKADGDAAVADVAEPAVASSSGGDDVPFVDGAGGVDPFRTAGELLAGDRERADEGTKPVAEPGGAGPQVGGDPVDVLPLDVAEAIAETKHRRRRLGLYVAVPTVVIGLLIALTQVRFGRGAVEKPREERDWEAGMALVQAGDTSKGIEVLEGAVATLPRGAEWAPAHVRLADVYRELGTQESHYLNSAIRHYTSVLDWAESAETPDAVISTDELLYHTAWCFAALGSYEVALEYYEQIDTEFPTSPYRPQSRFEAGEALLALGQYERGRQVLAEVAEAYPGDPLGEQAFFRFADSFHEQARSLKAD
jgi:TolA-binding protein